MLSELSARGIPLPVELILSLIKVESEGKAGIVNPESQASGLMQVMPITLNDFNQRHKTDYTINDLRGKSDDSVRIQLQIGIDVLALYWQKAYEYLSNRNEGKKIPIDDVSRIADLFYVAGPGATRKRLDQLSNPTWINVQEAFPKWVALKHPRRVFATPISWDLDKIGIWLESKLTGIKKISKNPKTGFVAGILLLMWAHWLMKGKKK